MGNNTYGMNNLIRDVSPEFQLMIENSPSFLKLLGGLNQSLDVVTGSPIVTNPKYEWVNESLSAYKTAITGFGSSDGDGVDFRVTSTAGFVVGSLFRMESAAGASRTEIVQVAAVVSATQLTVVRDYGSSTGVTAATGEYIILISTPKQEGSDAGSGILQQGTLDYNYTEIFDEIAELSNTNKATLSYDKSTGMSKQVMAAMVRLARKIENAVIHGVRVARSGDAVPGSMGGFLQFVKGSGGNIDTTGSAISQTIINNIFQAIYDDGGQSDKYAIICSPNQARRLTALNTSGSNPLVFKDNQVGQTLGNFVTSFIGDLPVNGGLYAQVFVAQGMLKDQIAVLDMNRIKLQVMRGLEMKNATLNGSDYDKQRLITELTVEVNNATKAHGIATGLTI